MREINFKYLMKSMFFFLKAFFIKQKYDVVFVYLNHFNRGNDSKNSFLAPMIETCQRNKIRYIIFEDTDLKGAYGQYPRNREAVPFDFITLLRILFRKVYGKKHLMKNKNDQYFIRERTFSKILNKTLFRNFDFNVCINMAGENLTLFRGLNSEALVCEYQHGIIYDGHEDYMINSKADDYILKNKAIFLLFGKGFQDLLIDRDISGYYNQYTAIDIGTVSLHSNNVKYDNNRIIVFSLQITTDMDYSELVKYVNVVNNIIQTNARFFEENNYEIILKHHPRFDAIKCPDIELNYSFLKFAGDKRLDELLEESSLHMTFHSTTAFEAALKSIPTIFVDINQFFSPYEIFFNQYKYPLENLRITKNLDLQNILKFLDDSTKYKESCQLSYQWAKSFYSDYDEEKFLNLVQKAKL